MCWKSGGRLLKGGNKHLNYILTSVGNYERFLFSWQLKLMLNNSIYTKCSPFFQAHICVKNIYSVSNDLLNVLWIAFSRVRRQNNCIFGKLWGHHSKLPQVYNIFFFKEILNLLRRKTIITINYKQDSTNQSQLICFWRNIKQNGVPTFFDEFFSEEDDLTNKIIKHLITTLLVRQPGPHSVHVKKGKDFLKKKKQNRKHLRIFALNKSIERV